RGVRRGSECEGGDGGVLGPRGPRNRSAAEQRYELACSLDHLVGAGEHARRQLKAERLCCLEVDDQLVLGGRLYRQIGRLLALENAIDVAGCAVLLVDLISSIGDQAATGDDSADGVDRRQ